MQGEERESCEHIHFAKYHPQEQIMLFKMCLRMKYVLQDHNQSLNVPHLEIQVNRTMLQKLPTNTVCNKQDHKDLWACKTGHNMFLEFLPSMSWWHLTPNRRVRCCTTSILSLKTMSTMQQGNALHQLAFFPFSCTKPGKKPTNSSSQNFARNTSLPYSPYETAKLELNAVVKGQWAGSYWLSCSAQSILISYHPLKQNCALRVVMAGGSEPLEHTLENRGE